MTLSNFINNPRSVLIAPAGHGKTHAIASCIKICPDESVQLVLTHTHAGISSIKAKLVKLEVPEEKYVVQTISGFAQMLVAAFYGLAKLGQRQEDPGYFSSIINKCEELVALGSVNSVLKSSYNGLFVDEYQDCNQCQHSLIMRLSTLFPTHLLGDPLQGIYDFDGDRVDMLRDLAGWSFFDILTVPWRWHIQGNTLELGKKILSFRKELLTSKTSVILENDNKAHFYVEIFTSTEADYYKKVGKFLRNLQGNSILVIVPDYTDPTTGVFHGKISDRAQLRKQLYIHHDYQLIEAIDDKSFYSVSKLIDETLTSINRARKKYKKLADILEHIQFNKTDISSWIDGANNRVKQKRAPNDALSRQLHTICDTIIASPSYKGILALLLFCKKTLNMAEKRPELYGTIVKSLNLSSENGKSMYSNMCDIKNILRVKGRKVEGKYIGTTLLTKGLEFEKVVILGANHFTDKRNFYVAISRATQDLYIITDSGKLCLKD